MINLLNIQELNQKREVKENHTRDETMGKISFIVEEITERGKKPTCLTSSRLRVFTPPKANT